MVIPLYTYFVIVYVNECVVNANLSLVWHTLLQPPIGWKVSMFAGLVYNKGKALTLT